MSTRNERRKRARRREREVAAQQATHSGRMMARVVKAESRQIQKPEDNGFTDLYQQDRAIAPPLPLDSLLQLYEENAIHSSCIDAKVADAVGRGWNLEVEDDEDDVDEKDQKAKTAEVRAKLRELARPSGISGGFTALCRQLAREYDGTGWGAWEISRNGDEIDGIFPIAPHTLRAVKNNRDLYVQVKGDKKVYFKRFGVEQSYTASKGEETTERAGDDVANEVIVLKHYNARSPYYGIPPWVSGVPAIAEFTAIREYNVSWFESGGTGDRLLHVTADEESIASNIADGLEEQVKAAKGVGHTTFITHGTDDTTVNVETLSPEVGKRDGQFQNRREDLVIELMIAHTVPPYRIGWAVAGALGGEAAGEMLDSYRYGVVEPMQEALEELLAETIFNKELGGIDLGGYVFRFKDLDWSNMTEEVERANAGQERGAMTLNEWREAVGMERSEDPRLDEYYVKGVRLGGQSNASGVDAVNVVEELTKALDAVVKGEAVHTPTAATDTDGETDPDPVDRAESDEADEPEPGVDKAGKKKKPWSRY